MEDTRLLALAIVLLIPGFDIENVRGRVDVVKIGVTEPNQSLNQRPMTIRVPYLSIEVVRNLRTMTGRVLLC